MELFSACNTLSHINRRTLLQAAGMSGICWLTPLAERLARAAEKAPKGAPAHSVIVLWLQGGPSQFETFDPHPNPDSSFAGGTKRIKTAAKDIYLAEGLPLVAEQMQHISLVRSLISKEGDHERATYNVKTGFRPDPTLLHPSIGAVLWCWSERMPSDAPFTATSRFAGLTDGSPRSRQRSTSAPPTPTYPGIFLCPRRADLLHPRQ